MKRITILLPFSANMAGFDNARQGFDETNKFLKTQEKPPLFNIEVAGIRKEMLLNDGKYAIRVDKLISEINQTDVIIIPPLEDRIEEAIALNADFYPWLNTQYKYGAQVVSLCSGAFLLAASGLLNGKSCVTHWRAAEAFRHLFPEVKLLSDKILTHQDGIYTGGGAFSSANLIVYLIEKFAGREAALYSAKLFQIDLNRSSQSPFTIFKAQKSHADDLVIKAQLFIEKNYDQPLRIDDLSEHLGLGRRTFERRFKKATANTVLEYIQRIRTEAAKKELERGHKTINEVMYEVGYNDTKAFRTVFKKIVGLPPADYRSKFSRLGA